MLITVYMGALQWFCFMACTGLLEFYILNVLFRFHWMFQCGYVYDLSLLLDALNEYANGPYLLQECLCACPTCIQ